MARGTSRTTPRALAAVDGYRRLPERWRTRLAARRTAALAVTLVVNVAVAAGFLI